MDWIRAGLAKRGMRASTKLAQKRGRRQDRRLGGMTGTIKMAGRLPRSMSAYCSATISVQLTRLVTVIHLCVSTLVQSQTTILGRFNRKLRQYGTI